MERADSSFVEDMLRSHPLVNTQRYRQNKTLIIGERTNEDGHDADRNRLNLHFGMRVIRCNTRRS